jgi:serine/threonine-protein kinase
MAGPARKTIGSYEVRRELGQGGMGVVYLARQPALEREVVIKALRRGLAEDASIEERFRREAQAAAGIHHQNVVAVHDCFAWRGDHFIVQEFVAGEDLAKVLQIVQRLDPRIVGLVALELARGLEEVHARSVVHRDLKPGNVMLGRGGEAKIADFGIALEPRNTALTQTGLAVGTPAYMSPEQHRGERADQRSDLFSFGVLLYEMLTGELPFPGSSNATETSRVQGVTETSLARRMEAGRYPPPRALAPETPRALARLIRACLRPKPKRRVQSASAVRQVLERLVGPLSPAECRAEIAAWLWERKVFQAERHETERVSREPAATRRGRGLRWAAALAACAAVLGGVGAVRLDAVPADLLPPVPSRRAAHIRFETAPRTEIRIDGGPTFSMPRAGSLELAPGVHSVSFWHPEFGSAERRIEVAAGEVRLVARVFETNAAAR